MTDRELRLAAAKAAGIEVEWRESVKCLCYAESPYNIAWNPLTDDGDALRLAVKLGVGLLFVPGDAIDGPFTNATRVEGEKLLADCNEFHENDSFAATRRAIVRAAAAAHGSKT